MSITLGTLNINDGTNYFVLNEGVDLGMAQTTWDEAVSYSGATNVQVNVHPQQALVKMSIPMLVKGSSVSDLLSKLSALWAKVPDGITTFSETLTWDSESFTVVVSTLPTIVRDPDFQLGFTARFVLELTREP